MAASWDLLRRILVLKKFTPNPFSHVIAATYSSAAISAIQSPQNPSLTSTELTPVEEFLRRRLDLSDGDIAVIKRKYHRVLRAKSVRTAEEAIELFKSFGVSDWQLRLLCINNPQILACRAEENLRPKLEALKSLGFTGEALGHVLCKTYRIMFIADLQGRFRRFEAAVGGSCNLVTLVSQYPQILGYSVERIERQVTVLKQSGMGDEAFRHLLFKFSTVLKGCPDRFAKIIDYLKKIGVPATSKLFLQALAGLARSDGNFEERISTLAEVGFSDSQIKELFAKQPVLLGRSPESLQRQIGFLVNSAGVSLHTIVMNPALLGLSLEKRIRPRCAAFRFLSASHTSVKLPSLRTFLFIGERALLEKYVMGHKDESKLLEIMRGSVCHSWVSWGDDR